MKEEKTEELKKSLKKLSGKERMLELEKRGYEEHGFQLNPFGMIFSNGKTEVILSNEISVTNRVRPYNSVYI